ncbi:putative carbamoyl-phosphate synthase L chain [Synechococcus sp. BIOS-E4-1]|uniref:carbamoyl-phosphate synthase n=1 Tax=Synechococcus sp. BIOS-E4-1 TaxID=1400864 RepID=UPI0016495ECC|nr:carbamoyl-phosphate synthase [Synechococcus sp. BIOS-E4-1]QNI53853.1 putative carbamoyl-phosphate synthase L chain [Synechococcus sp. BIOS-E4-1]
MQRSLRLSLSLSGAAALVLANTPLLPVAAQEAGSSEDLGVMEINLKDAVKFNWGFQGALQGAGTPNQAGIGGFLPIAVGENSVFFADVVLNANFADYGGTSSIVNTEVAGTTLSTSSRLGYRWLNGDRSWMFGANAGYDSRPMNTGNADSGVTLYDKESAFFQQIAAGLEAVSDTWNFNAYALVPVGDTEQRLNSRYLGGALDTYGLNVGYFITPELNASVGYYYQSGDLGEADGSGVQVELDYQIADGLTAGINVSYDEAFETRVSGNISYRFGSNITAAEIKKKAWQKPTIQGLSESVKNRSVRVHDLQSNINAMCSSLDTPRRKHYKSDLVTIRTGITTFERFHCNPGAPNATAGGWEPFERTDY